MKSRIIVAPLFLAGLVSLSGNAPPSGGRTSSDTAAKATLAPGGVIRLTFPDLPPTLFAMVRGQTRPEPAVSVRLPDNYTTEAGRTFPLLVWLGINDGGVGAEINQPMRIVGKTDYIVANFPLFRRTYDPGESWGIAVGVDDAPVMAAAYTTIMNRIRATIPNIDAKSSIIGGFSNGGHAVAAMLSVLDENTLKSFNGFFMIDSGFDWTGYKRTRELGTRHILFLTGGGKGGEAEEPGGDQWWRKDVIERVHYFKRCAEYMGVAPGRWRFEVLPGVGHEFPDNYAAILREWAKGVGG